MRYGRDGRPVVVGVDGSEHALAVVRWAAAAAAHRGALLRLVTAFPWCARREAGHPDMRDRYRELVLERAEISLGAAVRMAERVSPGIVVGVDGPESEQAVRFAAEAAVIRGLPLVAVHTWWVPPVDTATAPPLDGHAVAAAELEAQLHTSVDEHPDLGVERIVVRGRPVPQLLARSGTAQLVVVGSRRRDPLAGKVLGSVGNAIVHRAGCPVAVVRAPLGGGPGAP